MAIANREVSLPPGNGAHGTLAVNRPMKYPLTLAVLFALLLSACSSKSEPATVTPLAVTPSPSATASPSQPAPSPSPSPSASASATVSPTPIPLPSNAQLSAPSHDVVWALVAGVNLFRSTDRGETWMQRPVPSDFGGGELSFIDDQHGWLMTAASPATQCQAEGVLLWRTADAGANWEKLSKMAGPQGEEPSGVGSRQCKEDLSFIDASHGFLSAWDPNSPPVIYRTSDGGNSWSPSLQLPDPPGQQTSPGGFSLRPAAVQQRDGVLVVGALGFQHMYVYRSTDGGTTWTYAATVPNAHDVGSIAFLDATHWWVSAEDVTSAYTADAGATWQAAPGQLQFAAPIAPVIVFADSQVGYATVRGLIKRTTDGGAHWTDIQTPGTQRRP